MIIGIVGNRKGWSRRTIYKKLDGLNLSNTDIIVTGGAEGVDTFAMDYAKEKGIGLMVFYPDISKPIPERFYKRNEQIVLYSDKVIAFNKKLVSGTQNTINWCNLYNTHLETITSDCQNCKNCNYGKKECKKCRKEVGMVDKLGGGKYGWVCVNPECSEYCIKIN